MKKIFDDSSFKISKIITNEYSTSFSLGIRLFSSSIRKPIYAIYGFVRLADEIVDTFDEYNQVALFDKFRKDYEQSLEDGISLNPVLNAFQFIVHRYGIQPYVESFLDSMALDLEKTQYMSQEEYEQYIYGSADVVGLMCLKVFVNGDDERFEALKPYALKLGSAFQKVNFLRDIKHDTDELGRSYFPNIDFNNLDESKKEEIIFEIKNDFKEALIGIKNLPSNSRLGVYVAYKYYANLLFKLNRKRPEQLLSERIRISDAKKAYILNKAVVRYMFNLL